MDKRYQVFISSTFKDLEKERAKVQQAVMELECIPAGMEAFPAIDEEQFEFIKKVIDDCDYYLLIIGGRYGSISEETGLSYTEMEYDYAVSKKIRVIVLLHKDPDALAVRNSEQSEEYKKKLHVFRDKVSATRLVKFWNNADELPGLVSTSLSKTIRTYPAIGWVRASLVPDSSLYKELNDLRKENDRLSALLEQQAVLPYKKNLATLSDSVSIEVHYALRAGQTIYGNLVEGAQMSAIIQTTWGEIFSIISPQIFMHEREGIIAGSLADFLIKTHLTKDDLAFRVLSNEYVEMLRVQFRALDLINLTPAASTEGREADKVLIWSLTSLGEQTMLLERSIKKPNTSN
jgi:hypothetical protein